MARHASHSRHASRSRHAASRVSVLAFLVVLVLGGIVAAFAAVSPVPAPVRVGRHRNPHRKSSLLLSRL